MTEKLLPIEPGCLCMVITGVSTGKIVTAVRCLGGMLFSAPGGVMERDRGWEIDQCLEAWDDDLINVVGESELMRIDGNPDQTVESEEKEKVFW